MVKIIFYTQPREIGYPLDSFVVSADDENDEDKHPIIVLLLSQRDTELQIATVDKIINFLEKEKLTDLLAQPGIDVTLLSYMINSVLPGQKTKDKSKKDYEDFFNLIIKLKKNGYFEEKFISSQHRNQYSQLALLLALDWHFENDFESLIKNYDAIYNYIKKYKGAGFSLEDLKDKDKSIQGDLLFGQWIIRELVKGYEGIKYSLDTLISDLNAVTSELLDLDILDSSRTDISPSQTDATNTSSYKIFKIINQNKDFINDSDLSNFNKLKNFKINDGASDTIELIIKSCAGNNLDITRAFQLFKHFGQQGRNLVKEEINKVSDAVMKTKLNNTFNAVFKN